MIALNRRVSIKVEFQSVSYKIIGRTHFEKIEYFNSLWAMVYQKNFRKILKIKWSEKNYDIIHKINFWCILYKIKIIKFEIDKLKIGYFTSFRKFSKYYKKISKNH